MRSKTSKKCAKPLPYLLQQDSYPIATWARELRATFQPLLARRLPGMCYGGVKHGHIPQWVQRHKKNHPFFVKLDIQKMYPSLSHHHLRVELQLGYKQLLGLPYVPSGFKKKWLPRLDAFFSTLPVQQQGLPLNSAMSRALAPLVLVPILLAIKQREGVKVMVYVDDIVVLGVNQRVVRDVYFELHNHLLAIGLTINLAKVQQGRFASGVLDYCGYRFAGGRVGVCPTKLLAFKQEVALRARRCLVPFNERGYIKQVNRQLAGFAHYYKCGQVAGCFAKLDSYVRAQLRAQYKRLGLGHRSSAQFERLGLFNLSHCVNKRPQGLPPIKLYLEDRAALLAARKHRQPDVYIQYMEHFDNQNKEIIAQLKRIVQCLN